MKLYLKVSRCLPVLLLLGGLCGTGARAQDALSADTVIQKAVTRGTETRSAAPDFRYTKFTLTEELDSAGKVRERKEKVYDIVYRNGLASVNLLRVNGRAPSVEDQKKQTENEMGFRQLLGQSKTGKGDQRDNFLTPELVARFEFSLAGLTNVNGRAAYQGPFLPKI